MDGSPWRSGVDGGRTGIPTCMTATRTRVELLARYRELVRTELPRAARAGGWVVTEDHCFGRIVLDNAVAARWQDMLGTAGGPAYARLDDATLARAVDVAERIAAGGDPLLRELDERSLAWRGRQPTSGHRQVQ